MIVLALGEAGKTIVGTVTGCVVILLICAAVYWSVRGAYRALRKGRGIVPKQMRAMKYSSNFEAGTYTIIKVDDGTVTAGLVCPVCSELFSLRKHIIQPGGEVMGEITCPTKDCNFAGWIRLIDWRETSGRKAKTNQVKH